MSLDSLLEELRSAGFRIGVIIDEAHHGFGTKTQSVEFFNKILQPDYALMVTATPDDSDAAPSEAGSEASEQDLAGGADEDAAFASKEEALPPSFSVRP